MPKKETALKNASILATYLLIVWGLYRFLLFQFPEDIEELVIKPLIWLTPVFILLKKEHLGLSSIGLTTKNLFKSIYLSLCLGIVFTIEGVIVNLIKYGGVHFAANIGEKTLIWALFLSLATAISEEISFRGYLFNRVWHAFGNEWVANILTSIVWSLIHIPIAVFAWKLQFESIIIYLFLTIAFGIGSSFVFARTRNVASSILLHFLWEWPIILFR